MARSTTKGLAKDTVVSVARDGRRRARGIVIRCVEYPQGMFVAYRDFRTGAEHITALENVRADRVKKNGRTIAKPSRRVIVRAEDVA